MAVAAMPRMDAAASADDPWQSLWEAERAELQRSQRVQDQLRAVLETLRKRNSELSASNANSLAEARADPSLEALERDVGARREECEAVEFEHNALVESARDERRVAAAAEALAAEHRQAAAAAEAECEALEQRRAEADARREAASARARSMVAGDTLQRAEAESGRLWDRLEAQEAEASRLRQALVDSWAARCDPDAVAEGAAAPGASRLQDLDKVEEELQWLSRMQQESAAEVHRMQHLERQEAVLQAKVRQLSEEKAALQSARVDLGNAGGTLREAIASQSEGWVRRVDDLEQQRRNMDQDRVKLLNECADLQARLDAMAPELESVAELELQHGRLEGERLRLADESQRLRDVNGALGVLLLGDDAPPPLPIAGGGAEVVDASAVAEALTRVLQLQRRLNERQAAQAIEKQKLIDRIRELERLASQPDTPPGAAASSGRGFAPGPRGGRAGTVPPPAAGPLASATSALRGGFGLLRDAATAVL